MPDEYLFRGAVPLYWDMVYAEYQRLFKSLEREPFEFTEPNPNKQPLAEYVPTENSVILISFWNTEHAYEISVDAEFSPDREMVQVMVFYQGEFTKEGESALAMWREVKRALAKGGRLIDMTGSVVISEKIPKPQSGADLDAYFDMRQQQIKNGQKYTLIKIAKETGYEYDYVRQLHSKYRKKRGFSKAKKATHKRTHKN